MSIAYTNHGGEGIGRGRRRPAEVKFHGSGKDEVKGLSFAALALQTMPLIVFLETRKRSIPCPS